MGVTLGDLTPSEASEVLERLFRLRLDLTRKLREAEDAAKRGDAEAEKTAKELKKRLRAMPSILLLGPPGIGKTEVVWRLAEKLAEEENRELFVYGMDTSPERVKEVLANPDRYFVFVDLRLSEMEPADLLGIPRVKDDRYTVYMPPAWAMLLSKCPGILFLDELTNVQRPDVLAAAYKVTNERMAGEISFHDGVMIVAAGNIAEHSAIAVPLPTPLAGRFFIASVRAPTIDEWRDYMEGMFGDRWDSRVYGFLKAFQDYFIKLPASPETTEPYPSPRSWTKLALTLHSLSERMGGEVPDDLAGKLAIMSVGKDAGGKFIAFIKEKIDLEKYAEEPERLLKLNDTGKAMLCYLLARRFEEISREPRREKRHEAYNKYYRLLKTIKEHDMELLSLVVRMVKKGEPRSRLLSYLEARGGFSDVMDALMKVEEDAVLAGVQRKQSLLTEPEKVMRVPVSA